MNHSVASNKAECPMATACRDYYKQESTAFADTDAVEGELSAAKTSLKVFSEENYRWGSRQFLGQAWVVNTCIRSITFYRLQDYSYMDISEEILLNKRKRPN